MEQEGVLRQSKSFKLDEKSCRGSISTQELIFLFSFRYQTFCSNL